MSDPINPAHYHGTKVDEFIEEFKLGFRPGNAIKYIARHQDKGRPIEDLKKAIWYLKREVSRLEERAMPVKMGPQPGAPSCELPGCMNTALQHSSGPEGNRYYTGCTMRLLVQS